MAARLKMNTARSTSRSKAPLVFLLRLTWLLYNFIESIIGFHAASTQSNKMKLRRHRTKLEILRKSTAQMPPRLIFPNAIEILGYRGQIAIKMLILRGTGRFGAQYGSLYEAIK